MLPPHTLIQKGRRERGREGGREGGEEGERERGREFERGEMKTPLTTRVTAVWMLCPNDHKTQAE